MKGKKTEVLLKVIQRVYDKNPGMQKVIDALMKEVCAEEGVSPEYVCFILLLSLCCHNGYSRKKSKQDCRRNKKQLMKILGVPQKGENV